MMADQHEHHRAEDDAHDDHPGVGQASQVQPLCSRFLTPTSDHNRTRQRRSESYGMYPEHVTRGGLAKAQRQREA
jgi:hypothetical protein